MNDTPVREAIEQTIAEQPVEVSEQEETQVSESQEPQAEVKEEAQEPEVEKFAPDEDLAGLTPEQLLETKKNWERAYTQKRQKETAELKKAQEQIEELRAQMQQYQQQFAPQQEYEQGFDPMQLSPQEYQDYMADMAREAARVELQQKEEASLQEQALSDFVTTDSRLDENSPEHDPDMASAVQVKLAEALDEHLAKTGSYKGFNTKELTKKAVEEYEKKIDELVKVRTQKSVQAAKMREAKARKAEVRGTTSQSVSTSGQSIRDIIADSIPG